MVKRITTAFSLLLSLVATLPATAQKRGHHSGTTTSRPALRFLDAIQVAAVDGAAPPLAAVASEPPKEEVPVLKPETISVETSTIETATALQLKYAVLLNTEVEQIKNRDLFSAVDEWYGTRYMLGGSSKEGIDCSAFVQAIYAKVFQIPMPRTAKEQHQAVRQLSRTELQQGDLVFFNTRGRGITHVGIYLQNNKFAHAASSGGVMISDLFEDYWVKRFAGVGRYEKTEQPQLLPLKP